MTDSERPIGSPLTRVQVDFVEQAGRLLIKVREPGTAPRAAKAGYTEKAHQEGIALHREASGIDRPFSHALNDAQRRIMIEGSEPSVERYRVIDTFENTYFPRMHAAILYFVTPPAKADEIDAAFFMNLSQQPLGPQVVDSVGLFLARYEGLKKMPDFDGKSALLEALAAMGLTDAVVADMRERVDAAKKEAPAAPVALVPEAELVAADQKQLEAFSRLQRWYALWAGILRQGLDYHMRVRLGISEVKGGRGSGSPGKEEGAGTPASGEIVDPLDS